MGSAELIAQLNGLIDQLSECVAADCAVLSTAETLAGALECAVRRVEGLQVRVVDEMDRTGLFGVDGHHSAIAWSGFTCRTSSTVAGRRVRAARMFRDLGATGEAFMAGTVGVEQVALLARLHANPRCGDLLADSENLLLDHAQALSFPAFEKCTGRWLQLADEDGAVASRSAPDATCSRRRRVRSEPQPNQPDAQPRRIVPTPRCERGDGHRHVRSGR